MDAKEELLREILRPGEEFSPMPFWFFNDAFDEEKVKSQLEDYVEKGRHPCRETREVAE